MAVNTLMFIARRGLCDFAPPHLALLDGLCHVLGFSFVVCLLSLVRELFGSGSLWGSPVEFITIKVQGLLVPFSGFILLAFWPLPPRCITVLSSICCCAQAAPPLSG